jgi:hypothetical protein
MSVHWIARVACLLILFALVATYARFLGNRARYREVLESTPLAALEVALFNACCFLAAGIPPDLALLEERCDIGVRFEAQYRSYRKATPLLGPIWFWAAVLGALAALSAA